MTVRTILLIAIAQPAIGLLAQQAPPPRDAIRASDMGVGQVAGRVTSAETGEPVPRAEVHLVPIPSGRVYLPEPPAVATDANGRYAFTGIRSGRYGVLVTRTGFTAGRYGQRGFPETEQVIDVEGGQPLTDIDVALRRGGAILARVTDRFGDPMPGLNVHLRQYGYAGGIRRLFPFRGPDTQGTTNDRGEYRFHGLPPGDYYVDALAAYGTLDPVATGDGRLYAPTFYPGTASLAEAQRLTLGAGQDLTAAFPLVALRETRISGTIRTSSGEIPARSHLNIQNAQDATLMSSRTEIDTDGRFTTFVLVPGTYSIVAETGDSGSGTAGVARVPVVVTGTDLDGLEVVTGKGATVSGRFVFDTGAPPADLSPRMLGLTVSFPETRQGVMGYVITRDDWTFRFTGLLGRARLNRLESMSEPGSSRRLNWDLKAVLLDGRDITDTLLDLSHDTNLTDVQVVLTQKRTTISGAVTESQTRSPANRGTVVIFPDAADLWTPDSRYIAAAKPDQAGRFTISGLPPRNYLAAAVAAIDAGAERDPEVLARIKGSATPITLQYDEPQTVTLTLITMDARP